MQLQQSSHSSVISGLCCGVYTAPDSTFVAPLYYFMQWDGEGAWEEKVKGLLGPKQAGAPWPGLSWLTDRRPADCLCVSMGNGAVSLRRLPRGYPSVSWGVECVVCVTSKTNGQEVQPEKQQYLQNIYSEKRLGSVRGSRTISTKTLSAGRNPD